MTKIEKQASSYHSISSIHSRLVKSVGAQAIRQIANIIFQIISIPLFLHYWGKDLYGEWLLLVTIPTYFSIADLGFGSVAGSEMTMLASKGDKEAVLEVFQSSWVVISLISVVIFLITIIVLPNMPINRLMNISRISENQTYLILFLLMGQVVLSQQTTLFTAAYKSSGDYALNTVMRTIEFVAVNTLIIVVIACGGGPLEAAIAGLVGWSIGNTIIFLDLKHRLPWLHHGWRHSSRVTICRLVIPSLSLLSLPLAYSITLQGALVVVGSMLGPTAVVVFSTSRTLARLIRQITNTLTDSAWPELSSAFGRGDISIARRLHRYTSQITLWIGFIFGIFMMMCGPLIFAFWTHRKIAFEPANIYIFNIISDF